MWMFMAESRVFRGLHTSITDMKEAVEQPWRTISLYGGLDQADAASSYYAIAFWVGVGVANCTQASIGAGVHSSGNRTPKILNAKPTPKGTRHNNTKGLATENPRKTVRMTKVSTNKATAAFKQVRQMAHTAEKQDIRVVAAPPASAEQQSRLQHCDPSLGSAGSTFKTISPWRRPAVLVGSDILCIAALVPCAARASSSRFLVSA